MYDAFYGQGNFFDEKGAGGYVLHDQYDKELCTKL